MGNHILNISGISTHLYQNTHSAELKNQGKLFFINSLGIDTLTSITVEIADNETDREQGLMWRKNLPDTSGMIFIYNNERLLTFWMKNTYISLDIIFINSNKEIIRIIDSAKPLTETSLSSLKKSMFAIEVSAGFCKKHNIHINDFIALH